MMEGDRAKSLPAPDVGDFLFLFVVQLVIFVLPNLLFSDGSTGWHLSCGNYILSTGQIPHTDLFSAIFPDRPWVAYEWLFDLLIASAVKLGGLKLLAVILAVSIGFLFLAIYDRARLAGSNILVASFLVTVAILTAATHWLARPHMVTFWFLWIFVTSLEDYYRGIISARRLFAVLSLSMLFWVNCHPGFAVAFIVLAIYLLSAVVQARISSMERDRARFNNMVKPLLALTAVLFLVTFLNPYGAQLHAYIWSYATTNRQVIAATNEYLSPVFKGGLHPTCLEILFFSFICGLFVKRGRVSMPLFLTCLAFAHAALFAVRNMALYAIVATPAIAGLWGRGTVRAVAASRRISRISKSLSDFNQQEARCKMHIIPMVYSIFLMVVATTGGCFFGKELVKSTFDPACLPVGTTKYIGDGKIDLKHLFNFDNWSGYLIYTLNHRVFIDDRADFYGHNFYAEYSIVMTVSEGWQEILDKYRINWVLFPKESALAQTLRLSPNWRSLARDEASELFARKN